jgi:hypothetical protein
MKLKMRVKMEMVVRMRDEAGGGGEMRCELRGQRAGLPSWVVGGMEAVAE